MNHDAFIGDESTQVWRSFRGQVKSCSRKFMRSGDLRSEDGARRRCWPVLFSKVGERALARVADLLSPRGEEIFVLELRRLAT